MSRRFMVEALPFRIVKLLIIKPFCLRARRPKGSHSWYLASALAPPFTLFLLWRTKAKPELWFSGYTRPHYRPRQLTAEGR